MIRRGEKCIGHDDCDTWVPPRGLRHSQEDKAGFTIRQREENARNAWKQWKDDSVFHGNNEQDSCEGK
jgi:hypothetical protein